MTHCQKSLHSVATIKKNLKRLDALIKSPYVRPADYANRDRFARRLLEATQAR